MPVALAILFGLAIGLSLSLIGGGGSILTVPILVYVIGLSAHEATTTSLVIVGVTALAGAAGHLRSGRVAVPTALLFGAAGVGGAFAGAWLNHLVPGTIILLLFGGLMLVVAAKMLRTPVLVARESELPLSSRLFPALAAGLGVGVMTGFFGVGGGFLIVPALALVLKLPMRLAVGTSLVIIAINSAAGLVAQLRFAEPDLGVAALFIAGGLAGSLLGSRAAGRIADADVSRVFAVFVAVIGVWLVVRNGIEVLAG